MIDYMTKFGIKFTNVGDDPDLFEYRKKIKERVYWNLFKYMPGLITMAYGPFMLIRGHNKIKYTFGAGLTLVYTYNAFYAQSMRAWEVPFP